MPKWPSPYKKTTNRHKEWVALKKSHAAVLKVSKVDFDAGLGGAIDTFERLVKKLAAEGYGKKSTTESWNKVSAAAAQLGTVANTYQGKLSGLPAATKQDLTEFLEVLKDDAQVWQAAAKNPTPTAFGLLPDGQWDKLAAALEHMTAVLERARLLAMEVIKQRTSNQITDANELARLAQLEMQAADLREAVTDALPVVQRLVGLMSNNSHDATYFKVFKQEGKRAFKGPFVALRQELKAWPAILAGTPPGSPLKADVNIVTKLTGNIELELAAVEADLNAL